MTYVVLGYSVAIAVRGTRSAYWHGVLSDGELDE